MPYRYRGRRRRTYRRYNTFKRYRRYRGRRTFKKIPYKTNQRILKKCKRQLKRAPIYNLINTNQHENSVIKKFTRITQFNYNRNQLANANGIIEEDLVINHLVDPEDIVKYAAQYCCFNILGLVITIWISDTDNFTQLGDAGGSLSNTIQTQHTDPRASPQLYVAFATSALVQSELAAINTTSSSNTRRWASVPYVKRLNQINKMVRRWTLPKSVISETQAIALFAANNSISLILGSILPNNHPHGWVALFRDIAVYPAQMSINIHMRIDSTFLFQNRRPATT